MYSVQQNGSVLIEADFNELCENVLNLVTNDEQVQAYIQRNLGRTPILTEASVVQNILLNAAIIGQP